MSAVGWIIFLAVLLPSFGLIVWLLFEDAIVRIKPGDLGLVIARGKATDRVLSPGTHIVPGFGRTTVQEYPSLELAYLAGEDPGPAAAAATTRYGPPLRATLGDRAEVTLAMTVRFTLKTAELRSISMRFGPEGFWDAARDESRRAAQLALAAPEVGIADLFGDARAALQSQVGTAVSEALATAGLEVVFFALGHADLGATGEVIQGSVRAAAAAERERATAAARLARAETEVELYEVLAPTLDELTLRHRQVEVWRDLVSRWDGSASSWPVPAAPPGPGVAPMVPDASADSEPVTIEERIEEARGSDLEAGSA